MTETGDSAEYTEVKEHVSPSFEQASWEVVGELEDNNEFAPLQLQILDRSEFKGDPLFENFGGVPDQDATERWHLPEEFASKGDQQELRHEQELLSLKEEHAAELKRIEQEAFERGKQEGHEAAVNQTNDRWNKIESSITTIMTDLQMQSREAVQQIEQRAVMLAVEIARKILDTAVDINPEYIVQIVHDAVSHAGTALIERVKVSPEDFEFIEVVGVRNLIKEFDGNWDFESDPTIKSGCIVETSAGEIDYQLDKTWERIKENVVKVIR